MFLVSQIGNRQGIFLDKNLRRKGFTFMEILVCLSCIIALGVGAFYVAGEALNYGRYSTAKADIATISTAVSQYYFEMNAMPADLSVLTSKSSQYGPWLSSDVLKDPWGNDYTFSNDATNKKFTIKSGGRSSATGDDVSIVTTYQ